MKCVSSPKYVGRYFLAAAFMARHRHFRKTLAQPASIAAVWFVCCWSIIPATRKSTASFPPVKFRSAHLMHGTAGALLAGCVCVCRAHPQAWMCDMIQWEGNPLHGARMAGRRIKTIDEAKETTDSIRSVAADRSPSPGPPPPPLTRFLIPLPFCAMRATPRPGFFLWAVKTGERICGNGLYALEVISLPGRECRRARAPFYGKIQKRKTNSCLPRPSSCPRECTTPPALCC